MVAAADGAESRVHGLAPGSYVFAARAMDGVGRAGPPLRYGFIVEAPWYRRPVALVAWAVGAVFSC